VRSDISTPRIIAVACVAIVLTACGSTSADPTTSTTTVAPTTSSATQPSSAALVGTWERTGGDYSVLQGMVVEVDETATAGTIVSVPRNPYGFAEGDVKWSDFTGVSLGRIRIRDLVRDADTGLASYITGVITVSDDGAMLEVMFPSSGTFQVWTRRS
jgi:hypothetical protein